MMLCSATSGGLHLRFRLFRPVLWDQSKHPSILSAEIECQRESQSEVPHISLCNFLLVGSAGGVARPGGDGLMKNKENKDRGGGGGGFFLFFLADEKEKSMVLESLSVFNLSAVYHSERNKARVGRVSRLFAPICN